MKISGCLSVVKLRRASSTKRTTVTHCAAPDKSALTRSDKYIDAGIMSSPMKTQPTTERAENPSTNVDGALRRVRYCASSRSSFMLLSNGSKCSIEFKDRFDQVRVKSFSERST